MKKWMNLILLSCKRATELIEKQHVEPLTSKESMQLQIHSAMCSACKSYKKQSAVLDETIAKMVKPESESNEVLSSKTKETIIKKINEE